MKMSIWFTADQHFSHKNIIHYQKRKFKNITEMNEYMIKKWNSVVKPEDTVFHLGDFGNNNKKIKKRLLGNIIWIKGNHDKPKHSVIKDLVITLAGKEWYLVHNPQDACSEFNIVGHVHGAWKVTRIVNNKKIIGYAVNVGVDVWNYQPISIKTINKTLERFKNGNV